MIKTMKEGIEKLKNSALIPSDANKFKSCVIAKALISYSIERDQTFYRSFALLANKTPLQIKHLEKDDFSNFLTLLDRITKKLNTYQYEN